MTNWIHEAVRRPGALGHKARAEHETPMEFAETHAHAPGLTGRQARFALVVQGKPIPPERSRHRPLLPSGAARRRPRSGEIETRRR